MKRHLAYLKYVMKHKWYVLRASLFTSQCSLWRALTHDMSKFRLDEWIPYARTFYSRDGKNRYRPDEAFQIAWLKHQHRNDHHWQHWILRGDDNPETALRMPESAIHEMAADWAAAGKTITGSWDLENWFHENLCRMSFHELSEVQVITIVKFLQTMLEEQ